MNLNQKTKHAYTQIQILQSSINQINYSMELCDTNGSVYWVDAKQKFQEKLQKEESNLEEYKIKYPEYFI